MTLHEAYIKAAQLQTKWVGEVPVDARLRGAANYDLDRIHASMLQEHRWNREHPARCSKGCAAETFADLIMLGKVRKALNAPLYPNKA